MSKNLCLEAGLQKFLNVVAKNVRTRRRKTLLSIRNFAGEIGIGNSTLSDLEGGIGNPTLKTIYQIASFCNISPSDLLTDLEASEVVTNTKSIIIKLRRQANECAAMADFLEKQF